ncbi:2131_t:CDS:2 [Paraglomus occultum]|uniref:GPI inositol-deacylase n=1 Tax=Paraglomus occultum TaxID=144539 RepID=A0A9N8WM47_9GLOM|nr:2131_t:CDS:2 [Paraglomus occultum]
MVHESEQCETLQITPQCYDNSRTFDFFASGIDGSNGQQTRERTPSPTSPISNEQAPLLSTNFESINPQSNSSSTPDSNSFSESHGNKSPSHLSSLLNTSASISLSFSIILILLITMIMSGLIFDSFINYQRDTKGCEVTYMNPKYIKMVGFDSEQTIFAEKYGLYLYREVGRDSSDRPTGIPTLFIPGNAGSYKQVRSIASASANLYYDGRSEWDDSVRGLDFFTVDFNEEFSALHGNSLLEQAEYLNDAIRYILSLYPAARGDHPEPSSVIIIAHSMGGIVARTLFTMPNYEPGSINTIITMATPHLLPPAPLDWQISNIYTNINKYWRKSYSNGKASSAPLSDVTLISIAGGNLDTIICSDTANINSLVPASHGFTVFTTSIPNVWTSMDHQCILWCKQLVNVIAKTMLNIVDVRRAGQTKPRAERMKIFRKALLTGLEDQLETERDRWESFGVLDLEEKPHVYLHMEQRLVLKTSHISNKVYLMPIPPPAPLSNLTTFSLLTDHHLGKSSRLLVLLCGVRPNKLRDVHDATVEKPTFLSAPRLSCYNASHKASLMPASTKYDRVPSSTRTFSFLKLNVQELGDYQYVAIMNKEGVGLDGFLLAEFIDESKTITQIDTSMKDLLFYGIHVSGLPMTDSIMSTLHIPIIDNSLLTYKMFVNRPGCDDDHFFATFIRQSISSMHESKFLVNAQNVDINIHGQAPFVLPVSSPKLRKGLSLQFWIDPICSAPLSIDIRLDAYGSLGKIVMRFQSVLVAFPFMVVAMTLRIQLKEYQKGGPYMSFGQGLAQFVQRTLPKLLVFVSLLSIYQSISGASKTYSLADLFPVESTPGDVHKAIKEKASFNGKGADLQKYWDHYHYVQSVLIFLFILLPFNVPALMVWSRNLAVHWYAPFSSDHSILAIAPVIFYVEIMNSGKMLPRTSGR